MSTAKTRTENLTQRVADLEREVEHLTFCLKTLARFCLPVMGSDTVEHFHRTVDREEI